MKNNSVNNIIKAYSENEQLVNKMVVTSFVANNGIKQFNSCIASLLLNTDDPYYSIALRMNVKSVEEIISIFEQAISKNNAIVNGAVYTPKYIREYITSQCIDYEIQHSSKSIEQWKCADISCGCGAFLYTLCMSIREKTKMSFSESLNNIYGIDINEGSILRCKILLSLAAIIEGEMIDDSALHLYVGNALSIDTHSPLGCDGGFDIIVGNPPYVRSKNMDMESKSLLKDWSVSNCGNADLYIPFFEIGVESLCPSGVLGFITLNSFFKSVNARQLRSFFADNKTSLRIANFGDELIFKKLAYTCLTFINLNSSDGVDYARVSSKDIIENKTISYSKIDYDLLDNHRGWNLNCSEVFQNIELIESTGRPLGDKFVIKNGIATLANDVFIFTPTDEDAQYFMFQDSLGTHKVEKAICRDIVKPNILRSESDLECKTEKIIFPYDSSYNVFEEEFFSQTYPMAYTYLACYKGKLDKRDKGNGDYMWYEFGRSQAIANTGKKLLFPYMTDIPHFVYTSNEDMLIYCGYAIYHDSEEELLILKRILESSVFDYYIKHTSKPYSTGYYSYAKNYVKLFGVCDLTIQERQILLTSNDHDKVNNLIASKYNFARC